MSEPADLALIDALYATIVRLRQTQAVLLDELADAVYRGHLVERFAHEQYLTRVHTEADVARRRFYDRRSQPRTAPETSPDDAAADRPE